MADRLLTMQRDLDYRADTLQEQVARAEATGHAPAGWRSCKQLELNALELEAYKLSQGLKGFGRVQPQASEADLNKQSEEAAEVLLERVAGISTRVDLGRK